MAFEVDHLPENFDSIIHMITGAPTDTTALKEYVNFAIDISEIFSLTQVPPLAADLTANFLVTIMRHTIHPVNVVIDILLRELWPEAAPVPQDELPYFLPPELLGLLENRSGLSPLNTQPIRSELWRILLDTGSVLGDIDEELLINNFGRLLIENGVSNLQAFNLQRDLRIAITPATAESEPHLNEKELNTLVQFLFTPYEQAKNLPKNFLDDISTYFGRSDKPSFEVTLPGWGEIIHIFPDVEITPEEKKAWTAWRKLAASKGFPRMGFDVQKLDNARRIVGPPPLNLQQIEKMRKRWEIAKRINASPTPDTLQTVGNILTWFDDIQDALVTLSYLGRVGVTVLRHVVPRVALKAIPIVGWVSTAKDMMDIMRYIRALRIARSDKKRAFWDSLELLPRSRAKSLRHFTKLKRLLPTWRESVQIAQTTDAVFGTGLALGPIVGAVEDIFFGLFTGGTFHFLGKEFMIPTLFDHPKIFQQVGIFSPNMTPASLQAFRIINKASRVLPHLNHLPVDVVLNVFTALHYAWCYLAASGDLRDWDDWQKKTVNLEIKTQPLEWHTKEVLSELPFYPVRDSEPFGSPTHTSVTTPMHLANGIRNTFIDELDIFMEAHKNEDLSKYICSLINEITTNYLVALNGPDSEITETLQPFPSAIMLIFHYSLDEKMPTDPEQEILLISEIADLIIRGFGKWPSLARVQDLFNKYTG